MHIAPVMRKHARPRLIRQMAASCVVLITAISAALSGDSSRVIAPAFAVVELFTSEGCSSCPPAEALLGELASQGHTKGLAIYCLAFHVDYWNRLGWKDPFSAAAYSARQEAYARVLRSVQVYTPQMIVNGTEEFVGSDRSRAEHAINAALSRAASVRVALRVVPETGESPDSPQAATGTGTRVTYSVTGAPKSALLHIAAVEAGVVSRVSRGENAGRALRDENVVRAFLTVPLDSTTEGTVTLPIPEGTVASHTSIIGYVQDRSTMAILGAGQMGRR